MTIAPTALAARRASLLPAFWHLLRAEGLRLIRNPMFLLGTIGFPILFFALFGLPNIKQSAPDGTPLGPYMLIGFGGTALLSLSLFSFGVNVATERTGGWLKLLRASPMPAPLYFLAKLVAALVFSAVALAALYGFAHWAGGVTLTTAQAVTALLKLLLGMIPLVLMGLAIGFTVTPSAAQVIANVVSMVMSFGSGLYMPLYLLPKFVQKLAPYLPAYHLGEVGRSALTTPTSPEWQHWLTLAAFAAAFALLTLWGWQRDESREG